MTDEEFAAANGMTLEELRAYDEQEQEFERMQDYYDGLEDYEDDSYNGLTLAERNR